MKALISPNEGNRIVEVAVQEFPVAEPLAWVTCPENCSTQWIYDGVSFIDPGPVGPIVPESVTRAQARKALAIQGLFSLVQPAIDSIQDPLQRQLAQIDWDDSLTYDRNNATLAMLAAGLGLTEQQLDELFILAAQQP